MTVRYETEGPVAVVTIDRPEVRHAVEGPTAGHLAEAFRRFEADDDLAVAVLTGAGDTFCAGADLKAVDDGRGNRVTLDGDGPMGPTRMQLDKPVIAAVECEIYNVNYPVVHQRITITGWDPLKALSTPTPRPNRGTRQRGIHQADPANNTNHVLSTAAERVEQ